MIPILAKLALIPMLAKLVLARAGALVIPRLAKLALGKGAWVGIGAGAAVVGLLVAALAWQTHQLGQWRDAAAAASAALATEAAQAEHLRDRIDAQNARIQALARAARNDEAQASERAQAVLQSAERAIADADALQPGPDAMNAWFDAQWGR